MASVQAILADIDLRYRNTFSVANKVVWMNEEQAELFDVLELDSPPYTFPTVEGEKFYPFPAEFDVTKIKSVTYQINDAEDPQYSEIPFLRNDDKQPANYGYPWYTVTSDAMYLYAPNQPGGRNVYIYCDSDPQEISTANLGESPDLPTKFQELLKLGVLKRIALARKDLTLAANYDSLYQEKISDVMLSRKLAEPEFIQPTDDMPRAGHRHSVMRRHMR